MTASGDKLLGGPQCGIVVGRADLVERLRRNPLKRALRCDKLTLAALEATLRLYRFHPAPEECIPVLQALATPLEELERRASELVPVLEKAVGNGTRVDVARTEARVGSGSQPEVAVPSVGIAITSSAMAASDVAARLRRLNPPVIGRIENERVILDLRSVGDPARLLEALAR